MKKSIAFLLAALLILGLAACGQEEAAPIDTKLTAVIMDVDPDNRSLKVRDPGSGEIFGDYTMIDCREAPVRPAGSLNEEISFLDLQPGDRVQLSFSEKAREALQNGERTVPALQIEVGGGYPTQGAE